MKIFSVLTLMLLLASEGFPQDLVIKKDVVANGGRPSSSVILRGNGTIGQPTVGQSAASGFMVRSGFWASAAGPSGPCDYIVGDVNGSNSYNSLDITYGVAFFKGGSPPLYECECGQTGTWYVTGDVNGSCDYNGLDITYGVAYFKGGAAPVPCGDCPPN